MRMYPMDFEEFSLALGQGLLLEHIMECWKNQKPLEQRVHAQAMRLFREYMLVGGMPQSVDAYIDGAKDFAASDVEKRDILSLYRDDIKKAAKRYNSKVSAIFSKYDAPFFWLDDSMICNLCYKCNDPSVGFALNKNESQVKCYMGDTGLLVSHAFNENEIASNRLYKSIMDGKLSLNEGMLYENMIA